MDILRAYSVSSTSESPVTGDDPNVTHGSVSPCVTLDQGVDQSLGLGVDRSSDQGMDQFADQVPGGVLRPPGHWTCLADAAAYVEAAGVASPDQVLEVPARELVDLYRKLETLPVIEEAKGILMGYYGLSAATAFMVLRRWSQHGNTKLRVIAQALVDGVAEQPSAAIAPHDLMQRVVTTRHDPRAETDR